MKKICLCCALLFCVTIGLFAGPKEDREFRQYVEQTKISPLNPKGMTVAADYEKRIIYSAITLPSVASELTLEQRRQAKKAMLNAMKAAPGEIDIIKRLGIKFVFVYTSNSNNIITIELSPNDF